MHNRPDMNGLRPVAVATRRAFESSSAADVFVADEQTRRIGHVLMEPHRRGQQSPVVERLSSTSARVSLNGESETIHLGTDGMYQAAVDRDGKTVVLLQ